MQVPGGSAPKASPWGKWKGETVCIVASGPSLTVEQCRYTRGRCRVLSVNNNYERVPWCDAIYAADRAWWQRHRDFLPAQADRYTSDDWVEVYCQAQKVKVIHREGLAAHPGVVNSGLNSGFQAVNLAYHLGVSRILLIGYDFQYTGGQSHWHGDHPRGLNNPQDIRRWIKYWGPMARDLKDRGVEVINCTIDTALTQFPRATLEDVL